MSGAARINMQHFKVARLAAPSAVLLVQLQSLGGQPALPVATALLRNPALLIRTLDALHMTSAQPAGAPVTRRLEQVDQEWLDSLLRRNALHLALLDSPPNHAFLTRHWHVSRRLSMTAAALAQASGFADGAGAAFCGLLLRAGMLVLEQLHSDAYAVLMAGPWQQGALLAAERKLFQIDHVDAGVRLLESWQLDQFSIDALRYQALPREQILDAAPLVKICWFANALAGNPPPDLLRSGCELLGLTIEQVQTILAQVQQDLDNECAALGLPTLCEPLSAADMRDLALEAQQKLRQLRHEISTDNMLAQHAPGTAGGCESLQTRLARALQDVGIEPVFIVLGSAAERDILDVRTSNRVQPDPAGLRIVCAAGRNAVSTLILPGDAGVLNKNSPGLTVIDRQLLALLGGQTLLCEPVLDGGSTSVLLLGVPSNAVSAYLGQHALRRFIRRALLEAMQTREGLPASTLLLQQRVREAVHEANNPLAIMKNYLYILGMRQGNAGAMADEFQVIRAEIDRVAAILDQLRNPDTTLDAPRKLNLDKLVTAMHKMFTVAWHEDGKDGKKVEFRLQLDAGPASVVASEGALKQILTNLVKNAAEAIDAAGNITLTTRANIYLRDQYFVQLGVSDTGHGIAPELMTRLFSTGASTKGGAHTGSGLGIVRRLVEDMGGQLSCQSNGKGTAIDILLPMA